MAMRGLARAHNRQQKSRPKAAILCRSQRPGLRTGDPRFHESGALPTELRWRPYDDATEASTAVYDTGHRTPRKCSDGFSHFKALILETRCLALTGLKQNGVAMAQPKILLTRIDDRFICGQDIELWNEATGSNLVLIVNDEIAADSRQWAPMRVAAPRRRLDTVFLGAKDHRYHSYRNAASMDSGHGGLTRRCARAG